MSMVSFIQDLTLSRDWRQYILRVADFRPAPPASRTGPIAPARMSSFFLQGTGNPTQFLELQLDVLRFESPSTQK